MTDKEYAEQLKNIACCQNCVNFSLGVHFDGCTMGWCHRDKLETHYRDDVCMKFVRYNADMRGDDK